MEPGEFGSYSEDEEELDEENFSPPPSDSLPLTDAMERFMQKVLRQWLTHAMRALIKYELERQFGITSYPEAYALIARMLKGLRTLPSTPPNLAKNCPNN